jgi:predicted NBD/HSP70 family sugar kinase
MSGPATQAELARQTGLSTATVSNIVKIMQDTGLASTEPITSSGRRALNVRLNSNGAVAVGIDFGRRHLRVVLASLSYEVIAEESVMLPLGHQAEQGIQAAVALLDKLLQEGGVDRSLVVGAGVGIPGPIDRRTGTVAQGAILPEWVGINILQHLEDTLKIPVFVDNDANLGAWSEVTWGPHTGVSNLMFLKIGSGIGAGLILNSAPYYGNVGITGEIGHATIHEHGLVCRCGNRGCLETIAGEGALEALLRPRLGREVTAREVLDLVEAGDLGATRVVNDAGRAIGHVLADLCNALNPEAIIVGGQLSRAGEPLLGGIRESVDRYALPAAGQGVRVLLGELGDRAEVIGALALVIANTDSLSSRALPAFARAGAQGSVTRREEVRAGST